MERGWPAYISAAIQIGFKPKARVKPGAVSSDFERIGRELAQAAGGGNGVMGDPSAIPPGFG